MSITFLASISPTRYFLRPKMSWMKGTLAFDKCPEISHHQLPGVPFAAVFWMSRNARCVTSKRRLLRRLLPQWCHSTQIRIAGTYTWAATKRMSSRWVYGSVCGMLFVVRRDRVEGPLYSRFMITSQVTDYREVDTSVKLIKTYWKAFNCAHI